MNRLAAVITGLALATAPGGQGDAVLIVFLTPDSPGAAELLKDARASGLKVRPALLVERWDATPPDSFPGVVRAAGGPLAVYDREALDLARQLKLRDFPALVLVRGKQIHVLSGSKATSKELQQCR